MMKTSPMIPPGIWIFIQHKLTKDKIKSPPIAIIGGLFYWENAISSTLPEEVDHAGLSICLSGMAGSFDDIEITTFIALDA